MGCISSSCAYFVHGFYHTTTGDEEQKPAFVTVNLLDVTTKRVRNKKEKSSSNNTKKNHSYSCLLFCVFEETYDRATLRTTKNKRNDN